jgi:hypothetical protein
VRRPKISSRGFFDRGILSLEQFHQDQNGAEQSLDFVLGPLVQIGASNLPDQLLNFRGRGPRDVSSVGHLGRSSSRGVINNQSAYIYPGSGFTEKIDRNGSRSADDAGSPMGHQC